MKRSGGLVAALIGGLFFLGWALPSGTAQAHGRTTSARPDAPLPGYTPRFVTQTDERPPWDDCLWASGAMLLDKWTNGAIQPDRLRLRRASGDTTGGSNFADLARAVAHAYGWRPSWSPNGGDRMTWAELLNRLAKGGGAVIAGNYSRLGAPFTRWSRSYAADPHAAGHAMYVERYDAAHDRIWLMDPLGRDGYNGEWVPTSRIHSFIWQRRGFVSAMSTPAPPAKSAAGYVPGALQIAAGSHRAGDLVPVSLPIATQGPWPLPDLSLTSSWQLITADTAATSTIELSATAGQPTGKALVRHTPLTRFSELTAPLDGAPAGSVTPPPDGLALVAEIAMPDEAGLWRLTPSAERTDGKGMPASWRLPSLTVRVWGDRGALVQPQTPAETAVAGDQFVVGVAVEDAGAEPWTAITVGPQLGEEAPTSATQLEAAWVNSAGESTAAMSPIRLASASGQQQSVSLSLIAPRVPGAYVLRFDVRDAQGSLLAPEDTVTDLPLTVAPAPFETIAPTQNQ